MLRLSHKPQVEQHYVQYGIIVLNSPQYKIVKKPLYLKILFSLYKFDSRVNVFY